MFRIISPFKFLRNFHLHLLTLNSKGRSIEKKKKFWNMFLIKFWTQWCNGLSPQGPEFDSWWCHSRASPSYHSYHRTRLFRLFKWPAQCQFRRSEWESEEKCVSRGVAPTYFSLPTPNWVAQAVKTEILTTLSKHKHIVGVKY